MSQIGRIRHINVLVNPWILNYEASGYFYHELKSGKILPASRVLIVRMRPRQRQVKAEDAARQSGSSEASDGRVKAEDAAETSEAAKKSSNYS